MHTPLQHGPPPEHGVPAGALVVAHTWLVQVATRQGLAGQSAGALQAAVQLPFPSQLVPPFSVQGVPAGA